MWKIEIRDNSEEHGGEIPGKLRETYVSRLPSVERLRSLSRFAVMVRIPRDRICAVNLHKASVSAFHKQEQQLKERFGNKVVLFPAHKVGNF